MDVINVKELHNKGYDIDKRNEDEQTPLLRAVINAGPFELISAYLSCGANPNAADKLGATPLYYAFIGVNLEFIQLLLEFGADIKGGAVESDPRISYVLQFYKPPGGGPLESDIRLDSVFQYYRTVGEMVLKYKLIRKVSCVARLEPHPNHRDYYLEYRDIVDMNLKKALYTSYGKFLDACTCEILLMNRIQLDGGFTLAELASSSNFLESLPEKTVKSAIVQICKEHHKSQFPIYYPVIEYKIKRDRLLKIINEQSLLAAYSKSANRLERKYIVLNSDIVNYIANYLFNVDLLNLVGALCDV